MKVDFVRLRCAVLGASLLLFAVTSFGLGVSVSRGVVVRPVWELLLGWFAPLIFGVALWFLVSFADLVSSALHGSDAE